MGMLTEAGLEALCEAGCKHCGAKVLEFRAMLDGRLPLMEAEPVGSITWVYDGEKFVDGVYEVFCTACKSRAFFSNVCPRCNAEGRLDDVLATENRWPVPKACPRCDNEEVRYVAMLPARVVYEGKRAQKPRTFTELLDPGFHGMRVECRDCRVVAELTDRCPLCDAPAPLRPRP